MLDGLTKHHQDRLWDRLGRVIARAGVTPNQITVVGTIGVLACAAAYPLHARPWALALGVAVFELSDNLDGAVARVTGASTPFGAWLDAFTDRYKDAAVLFAVSWVHDAWALGFLAVTGAMLTSYAKARAGMEVRVSNTRWPDLFERLERIVVLVVALVAQSALAVSWGGWEPVHVGLAVLAAGTHLSATQRGLRARALLS